MTLLDVTEVFSYLNQHPTSAEILTAVHEVKVKKPFSGPIDENEFNAAFNSLPQMMGTQPEKISDEFRDNLVWAEEQMAKLKSKKPN